MAVSMKAHLSKYWRSSIANQAELGPVGSCGEVKVMAEEHRFEVIAWWTSGRTGITKAGSAPNAIHFTSPQAFGGVGGRWTPEELLLASLASCYITTFSSLAEASGFDYIDLEVEVKGMFVEVSSGFAFTEILICPKLTISVEPEKPKAVSLLLTAKTLCLVARTLSVEQKFEPMVRIAEPNRKPFLSPLTNFPIGGAL
jgi:organic hydroperoxide reductase OsmC/OhrA